LALVVADTMLKSGGDKAYTDIALSPTPLFWGALNLGLRRLKELSELLRNSEESFIRYADRIITGKETGVYDINNSEVWELLFNEQLSKDEARKRLYAVKKMIEVLKNDYEEDISEDNILKEIELQKRELEKMKMQFRDQKRENTKILREESRFDNIKDFIKTVANEIAEKKPFKLQPVKYIDGDKHGVLLISDWHYLLEVDNFLNKFNQVEFERRINKLVSRTIQYGRFHDIKVLHICNLGDLISGLIHTNVRVTNAEDTVTQTQYIAELLSEILYNFSCEFEEVKFYSVLDNHSRITPNKDDSLSRESFMRFIPWYVEARVKNIPNLEVISDNIDEDIAILDILGHKCFMVHGHRDNVASCVQNLTLMTKIFAEYIFVSHFHHLAEDEIHGCEPIMNASLIGTDDYAKHLRRSSKPAQKFMIFNKEDGREATYNIRLDN
jgi:hypothetical protein